MSTQTAVDAIHLIAVKCVHKNTYTERYNTTQGSHRNLIIKFHDFSMTIYTVFHDARKANTEDHSTYSTEHIHENKLRFLFKLKRSRKDGLPPAYHYDLESRT